MTGLLHERELSRRTFLKGGGALVVGFSIAGAGLGAKTAKAAGEDPFGSNGPYDPQQIDSWVMIHADNTATMKLGKIELGQGSVTGLLVIAAEELDLAMSQMKFLPNDTNVTPDQGTTAGSSAVSGGGKQVRAAAAAARSALLDLAAARLGVAKTALTVRDGVVSGGGKSVKYGELLGDRLFNVQMAHSYLMAKTGGGLNGTGGIGLPAGAPGTKPVGEYRLVGTTGIPRVDIPAKINGTYTYVHSIRVPGMLHGRIVRPRGQGAYGDGTAPAIESIDAGSISHIPNVQIVRKGSFLGVVAPREYDAIQAAAQLKVKWADPPQLPTTGNLWHEMRTQDTAGQVGARFQVNSGNVDAALASAAKVISNVYRYHYNGHLPIGPSCCVADVTSNGARIFSNAQNAYGLRSAIALVTGLPESRIRVSYYEGSSVYGSSPQTDVAQSAAIMSQLVGKPVRLQFMRWDEHGWDNYGPAQMVDLRAGIDAKGNIVGYEYTGFQIPYWTTPPPQQMVTGKAVFATSQGADTSNTGAQYAIANRRIVAKSLPLENNYFKVSFLRAPIAPQSLFASEQMIDELAHAANMDPYQFRLQNIATTATDAPQRWKNVLTGVAALAGWQPKVAASRLSSANVVTGRGLAIGTFAGTMAGIVADVQVNKKTGKILLQQVHGVQDTGLTIYPDGVVNQAVGSITQGASRALFEEVAFDRKGVTSLDWVTYPIMRFKDAPKVTFKVLQRTDIPATNGSTVAASGLLSTGSGEPPTAPMAAAIANAFFDATGVRIREAPMTPARVRAVLKAAGVA